MNFSVIFSNIIGFDGLIFILASVNAVIFINAKRSVNRLYSSMHRHVYTPCAGEDVDRIDRDIAGLSVQRVSRMREQAESRYTLYVNITGLFPLLGILGTVISLLGMVGSSDSVTNGFFAALTSTFWGLVAAIAFKFSDGFISSRLDDGARAAELYIARSLEEMRSSSDRAADGSHGEKASGSSGGMGGRNLSAGFLRDTEEEQCVPRGEKSREKCGISSAFQKNNEAGNKISREKNAYDSNISQSKNTDGANADWVGNGSDSSQEILQ